MANKKILNYIILLSMIVLMDTNLLFKGLIILLFGIGVYYQNKKNEIRVNLHILNIIIAMLILIFIQTAETLPENKFMALGVFGFSVGNIIIDYLNYQKTISKSTKKNVYLIWIYTSLISAQAIGVYGYLGYKCFFQEESYIGILKVLFIGILYNWSQVNILKKGEVIA